MYFLVLIWQDPDGAEHFLLGAKCNANGAKPSFKAPFTAPTQQTYRTGDVAKTAVHFTSGPEARSGSGGKPRAQTQLPSGGYKQEPGMDCKRIEILAQRPTRTVPRNSDTDWPQGMPTYLTMCRWLQHQAHPPPRQSWHGASQMIRVGKLFYISRLVQAGPRLIRTREQRLTMPP